MKKRKEKKVITVLTILKHCLSFPGYVITVLTFLLSALYREVDETKERMSQLSQKGGVQSTVNSTRQLYRQSDRLSQ